MARGAVLPIAGFCPVDARAVEYIDLPVATNNSAAIYPGEPVIGATTGYVSRTPAGSAAGAATDGITAVCIDIIQYKDSAGFVRRNARLLPASTTYSVDNERSLLLCVLATSDTLFRVKGSAAVADISTARALSFANADHSYGTADSGLGLSGCQLNLGTVNTTATLQWRIVKWEDVRVSNDPTVAGFTCLVVPNLPYALPIVGHSATGI